MEYTLKELENKTCRDFGGNNCVLHGCMFSCQLLDAKKRAMEKEKGLTKDEIDRILKCNKS